jgi:hypothetical protein
VSSTGLQPPRAVDHPPKPAPIGTWQQPARPGPHPARPGPHLADEELPEPRVAELHLAFDRLADPANRQLPAFEARAGRWEELRWSLERIRHRFGAERLWRAELVRPTAALAEQRYRLAEIDE